MSKPIWLYSRSHVTTDWFCPRARYYHYEFKGTGIVSSNTTIELWLGTVIHDALAGIARGHDPKKLAQLAYESVFNSLYKDPSKEPVTDPDYPFEQATLVQGLILGFYKHVWPRLMAQYPTILFIEEEMEFHHDGLTFLSKPDLVLQAPSGEVAYIEYKSTSNKKDTWINSWNTAVQLHSGCKAVEATKGIRVDQVIVSGLYKGYESYDKQNSPFCYAYRKEGQPPLTPTITTYEYKPGYKKFPVWQLEGGIEQWVEEMPEEVLAAQFPQTPPIFVKDQLVGDFFASRAYREHEIKMALEMVKAAEHDQDEQRLHDILNCSFPQRFENCQTTWGKPCQFRRLCFGNPGNPLEEGFEVREPHHLAEQRQRAEQQAQFEADWSQMEAELKGGH